MEFNFTEWVGTDSELEVAKLKHETGPCKGWPNSHMNEEKGQLSSAQFHTGGRHGSIKSNRNKIENCIYIFIVKNCPTSKRWVQNMRHDVI